MILSHDENQLVLALALPKAALQIRNDANRGSQLSVMEVLTEHRYGVSVYGEPYGDPVNAMWKLQTVRRLIRLGVLTTRTLDVHSWEGEMVTLRDFDELPADLPEDTRLWIVQTRLTYTNVQ